MDIEFIDLFNMAMATGIVVALFAAYYCKQENAALRARNTRRRQRWNRVCTARGYPLQQSGVM